MNQLSYSALAQSITAGSVCKHYKGLHYKIIGVARHTESLEELVVYQGLYGANDIWVRPLAMFLETVIIDGQEQSRFELVK
jgi:hypothetical protein